MNMRTKKRPSSTLSEEDDSIATSVTGATTPTACSSQTGCKRGIWENSTASKKIKTNSGKSSISHQQQSQVLQQEAEKTQQQIPCYVKTADEIARIQQSVNKDCDIDCDGFVELFVSDLYTGKLEEAALKEQTIILRDAAGSKGFNTNPKELFSFESVTKNHGDMEIECRIQNPTIYDYHVDHLKNKQHIYRTSISQYNEYATMLDQNNIEELSKQLYYKNHFSKLSNGVMFAVNVDMDDQNWKQENMRLRSSLPHFLLNKGRHDVLSYHRQNVMGCTQPQMYLKVAGVWTGGHQENISARAVNINHGNLIEVGVNNIK